MKRFFITPHAAARMAQRSIDTDQLRALIDAQRDGQATVGRNEHGLFVRAEIDGRTLHAAVAPHNAMPGVTAILTTIWKGENDARPFDAAHGIASVFTH